MPFLLGEHGHPSMLDRLNAALDLLKRDLAEGVPVDVSAVVRAAVTSEHHLRRTFSTLAGMPIGECARRRRMTLAAADVLEDRLTLLDVAVRHGSTEAFTRAFRAVRGVSPGEARRTRPQLVSQPRVSFHLIVEGSRSMRYRIVEKRAFGIVGARTRVPLVHLGRNSAIEEFVRGLDPGIREQIAALSDLEPSGSIGDRRAGPVAHRAR